MRTVPDAPFIGRLIAVACIASAIVLTVTAVLVVDRRPRTHDAYLYAFTAGITSEVSGRIVQIAVQNGQTVHKGDVLLKIDPEVFDLKRQQADAQVDALEAQIALTGRQVQGQDAGALAAVQQVERARHQLALARDTRGRLEPLQAKGYATTQALDQARTDERSAKASLAAAEQQASQAKASVGDVESLRAQLAAAKAAQALAARNLRECTVVAPVDGEVVGFGLALGSFALEGHPLFTLIDTDHWYAIANFRETDLAHLREGSHATVWLMGDEDRPLAGTVQSIGNGVQPQGVVGPGLPQVDRNLNWVVVAQRFPVWVRLDRTQAPFLRIGATASVRVSDEPPH